MEEIRTSDRVLSRPRQCVYDVAILQEARRFDSIPCFLGHCGVNETEPHSGADFQCGGKCNEGHCLGNNLSIRNLRVIAEGLTASSLDLGQSISTAAGFNLNDRCPLESEEWQSCPPTDSDNGLIVATEMNERVETFKKLGIHNWCGNLSGKNSGFHEYVQPHLNEASLKVVSTISTHFINFSMACLAKLVEAQLSRCCQVLTVYSTDYKRTIMEYNETSKFKIQQPPRSMLQCGLEEKRFVFVTRSLEETLAALKAWKYDKESLVTFEISSSDPNIECPRGCPLNIFSTK